jgi:tetratricopeptide (TPR) repeat protein/DNA-binding MarR family transcriptional regulator
VGRQTFLPIEILDYIETHGRSGDEVFGISQAELAKSLGYHPASMSRPLDDLVSKGLLLASRGLVRGGRRKQLTYRLTPAGITHLRRETRDVPLLGRDVPPPPRPFLGRRAELESLEGFSGAYGGVAVIEGAAGMGKTALVAVHLRSIQRGRVPFWYTVRSSSSPREFVSGLSHALSFAKNPQLAYYAQLPRNPIAREVADMVARTLGNHPLAAVVDDYQHAPADFRKFLGEFIEGLRSRGPHQFFLVGQSVGEPSGVQPPVHRLRVGGLDRPSAHDLTDRQGGLSDRFEQVYQSTLGSPLLLKLAASNPHVDATPGDLPLEIVRQLSAADLRGIVPAALANEPLPSGFLMEETGLSAVRLAELVRMGILHQRGNDRVEVLEVVRRAVLGRVAPEDERASHLALARFYGRSHRSEALRERFLHLTSGEDLGGAFRLLDEHQQTILRLGYSDGLRAAMRHLASGLPRGSSRVRALLAEAALLRHHSEYTESIGTLRRAVEESEPESPLAAEARFTMVEQMLRLGQLNEAVGEFDRATAVPNPTRRLATYARLAEARIEEARGHPDATLALYQEAVSLSKRARAQDLGLEAIAAWSRLAEATQGAEVALKVVEDALPQARAANRMDVVFNLLLVRSRAYADTGRDDLAELEMRQIQSEAESLGYLNQLAYTLSGLASIAASKANWADAARYFRQASSMAERLGNDLVLGHTLATQCASEMRQAELYGDRKLADEALAHGERSVEVLSRLPPSESLMLANSYLAEVCLLRHEPARAHGYYDSALAIGHRLKLQHMVEQLEAEVGPRLKTAESLA